MLRNIKNGHRLSAARARRWPLSLPRAPEEVCAPEALGARAGDVDGRAHAHPRALVTLVAPRRVLEALDGAGDMQLALLWLNQHVPDSGTWDEDDPTVARFMDKLQRRYA